MNIFEATDHLSEARYNNYEPPNKTNDFEELCKEIGKDLTDLAQHVYILYDVISDPELLEAAFEWRDFDGNPNDKREAIERIAVYWQDKPKP